MEEVAGMEIDKLIAKLEQLKIEAGTSHITAEVGALGRVADVKLLPFRDGDMASFVASITVQEK